MLFVWNIEKTIENVSEKNIIVYIQRGRGNDYE